MRTAYDRRLQILEATELPPQTMRVLRRIINPDRSLASFYAQGRHFERAPGESDDAFEARVCAAIGWTDDVRKP
jgi:hypothetical protein